MAPPPSKDPTKTASAAGLRYVTDDEPGITRKRHGKGFAYHYPSGRQVKDQRVLDRIHDLAIPPAWTDVWISRDPRAHLQATGRDDAGRKQYRYHEDFREARDEVKFERMRHFGEALPRIRRQVLKDLRKSRLPREKVLALVVRLLDETAMRVGNDEYAEANKSYGLTTLRDQHADVKSGRVTFRFKGKSGKDQEIDVKDATLARLVKKCRDVPGQELFQYVDDDGTHRVVDSGDVNDYIREAAGGEAFTAKDFRTWNATVLAAEALDVGDVPEDERERKRDVKDAVEHVAEVLGNTVQVTRSSYVHPGVMEAYEDGKFELPRSRRKHHSETEARVLRWLEDEKD